MRYAIAIALYAAMGIFVGLMACAMMGWSELINGDEFKGWVMEQGLR